MRSIEDILTDKVHSVITQDRGIAIRLHNLAARLATLSVTNPDGEHGLRTLVTEAQALATQIGNRTAPKTYHPEGRLAQPGPDTQGLPPAYTATGRIPSRGPLPQTNAPRAEEARAIREAFTQ